MNLMTCMFKDDVVYYEQTMNHPYQNGVGNVGMH